MALVRRPLAANCVGVRFADISLPEMPPPMKQQVFEAVSIA
jgi:hypothetical protein